MTTCTFSTMACCWVGVVNVLATVQRLPAVLLCGFLPFCCGSLHWRLVRLAVTWQCAPASSKPPACPPACRPVHAVAGGGGRGAAPAGRTAVCCAAQPEAHLPVCGTRLLCLPAAPVLQVLQVARVGRGGRVAGQRLLRGINQQHRNALSPFPRAFGWCRGRHAVRRFLVLGLIVAATFGVSLGPFAAAGQLQQASDQGWAEVW